MEGGWCYAPNIYMQMTHCTLPVFALSYPLLCPRNISQILERESDHSLEDKVNANPPIPASIISECTI
jgi:hypothetical protein